MQDRIMMSPPKNLKEVEKKWYKKLKDSGFEDIENYKNPDKPLKSAHDYRVINNNYSIIKENEIQYQRAIDNFVNHPDFLLACKSMVKHGNCKFVLNEVKLIWEMHVEGKTRREMARRFGRSKGRIDAVIEGLRQWMKLV